MSSSLGVIWSICGKLDGKPEWCDPIPGQAADDGWMDFNLVYYLFPLLFFALITKTHSLYVKTYLATKQSLMCKWQNLEQRNRPAVAFSRLNGCIRRRSSSNRPVDIRKSPVQPPPVVQTISANVFSVACATVVNCDQKKKQGFGYNPWNHTNTQPHPPSGRAVINQRNSWSTETLKFLLKID